MISNSSLTVGSNISVPLNFDSLKEGKDLFNTTQGYFDFPFFPPDDFGAPFSSLANQPTYTLLGIEVIDLSYLHKVGQYVFSSVKSLGESFLGVSKENKYPLLHNYDAVPIVFENYVVCPLTFVPSQSMFTLADLKKKIGEVEKILGYEFKDKELLMEALCHSSFASENRIAKSNERLEFLGDSVLELYVSKFLFDNLEKYSEGNLTKVRASLIDRNACSVYFNHLKLSQFLLLGVGKKQELIQGVGLESIYADFFEAILGAIFQDGGMEEVKNFCKAHCDPYFKDILTIENPNLNWKGNLQEFCVKTFGLQPTYKLIEQSGACHAPTFKVKVTVQEGIEALGEGTTKKGAEQAAAKELYKSLQEAFKKNSSI